MVTLVRGDGATFRHRANVVGMYVVSKMRGRGVGRALLVEACTRARQVDGLEQLHLAVVTTNTTARHLCRSVGFQSYGLEPHALQLGDRYWDEEFMVLQLRGAQQRAQPSLVAGTPTHPLGRLGCRFRLSGASGNGISIMRQLYRFASPRASSRAHPHRGELNAYAKLSQLASGSITTLTPGYET